MAKDRKQSTTSKKGVQKPSFFERVRDTFRGIRRELKRVVWPNKKTMRENTTAVLVITIVVTVLLFFTDTVMVKILDAAGFNVVEIESPMVSPATETEVEEEADVAGEAEESAAVEDSEGDVDSSDEESNE